MNLLVNLGERIKKLRKAAGLTQTVLAETLDLSVNYIGAIERGKRSPSLKTLQKIAAALDVTLAELFYFKKEEYKLKKEQLIESLTREMRKKEAEDLFVLSEVAKVIFGEKRRKRGLS
ncbi:MAG: helix-turn-helix transcriptional regulator [Candidatus Edwardsbacteria bacterium]